jgi:ribosome-binding factor A
MKPFSRSEKVSGLIHKALSEFLHKHVSDPRLDRATITGVEMTPDLRIAKIYFTAYDSETDPEELSKGFKSARGYVKRHLAGKLGLKYMPEFQFHYDDSLERGSRIDSLLKTVQQTHGKDNSTIEK